MGAILISGAEIGVSASSQTSFADGKTTGTGTVTRDTSIKRTGAASFKCAVNSSQAANIQWTASITSAAGASAWFYVTALPSGEAELIIMRVWNTGTGLDVKLNASGQVILGAYGGSNQDTSTVTISTSTWFCIRTRQTGTTIEAEVYNGSSSETLAGTSLGSLSGSVVVECGVVVSGGVALDCYVDDVYAVDSGSALPPRIKAHLATATADSQVGSWTGGSGGTSNLYQAIDNTPPVGTASESDTTQIENNVNGGGTEYRPTMQSYTAAGVGSGNILAICGVVDHGEDINTGTKTGQFQFYSNPADGASYTTFDYGDNVGALGSWPTNWRQAKRFIDSPSVTNGTAIVLALQKTDTTTRVASVDFMGVYIAEEQPGTATWTYSPTGGITFGGSAGLAKVKDYPVSGGITFGGAATTSYVPFHNEWIYSPTGGISFGGAADKSWTKNYTPSGGITFGGAADKSWVKDYMPSGGISFGGAADKSWTKDYVPSGGITFGGAADTSKSLTWTYAPSGGITFGGAADKSWTRVYNPAGGITFGGAADKSWTRVYNPTGGIVFGGAAITIPPPKIWTYSPTGGIDFAGAAGTLFQPVNIWTYSPTGGISFGGAAEKAWTRVYNPTGGIAFGGAADKSWTKNYAPSGGIAFGGAAVTSKNSTWTYDPTGGVVFGGGATWARTRAYDPTGGIAFGGAAAINWTKDYVPSGGIVFGGAALSSLKLAYFFTGYSQENTLVYRSGTTGKRLPSSSKTGFVRAGTTKSDKRRGT